MTDRQLTDSAMDLSLELNERINVETDPVKLGRLLGAHRAVLSASMLLMENDGGLSLS